jgi:hypothetical protein
MSNQTPGRKETTPEGIAERILYELGGYAPDFQRRIFQILADGSAESIAEAELEERIWNANERLNRATERMSPEQTEALAEFAEAVRGNAAAFDFAKILCLLAPGQGVTIEDGKAA